MKDSTRNRAQGKFHEVKGKVKEAAGHAVNDPQKAQEGHDEKVGGKIQKKVGEVEQVFNQ